jgi:hypothetical protein
MYAEFNLWNRNKNEIKGVGIEFMNKLEILDSESWIMVGISVYLHSINRNKY